jgi:RNA polymerase sigma-70 factor, ECF subfamily
MADATQKESEFDLIRVITGGDGSGYRTLVERYSPMVFHIVRRFEKDEDEVNELAQQIFVKAYEKLHQFDMKSAFSTWLYRLAMNHCRDYAKNIRRSNRNFSEMEPDFVENSLSEEQTPYLRLEMKEWRSLLDAAIDKLSTDYAEPFLWKYRDGISYEVMSEQTGISVSALKVRVHRARKELKAQLDKEVSS